MAAKNTGQRRTVLITGITGGIGSATAEIFAGRGWAIMGQYCAASGPAKELADRMEAKGVPCELLKSDFSDPTQLESFVSEAKKRRVDSLINNAGSYVAPRHYSELRRGDVIPSLDVNIVAPLLLTAAVFDGMKARSFGRIVNVSSVAAKYGGSPTSIPYAAAKRAMEAVARTFAREGAAFNVFVNTVRPGVIDTAFHSRFPKDMKKRISLIPAGRAGKPEDVASLLYYLGSGENGFITNETVAVAGGE